MMSLSLAPEPHTLFCRVDAEESGKMTFSADQPFPSRLSPLSTILRPSLKSSHYCGDMHSNKRGEIITQKQTLITRLGLELANHGEGAPRTRINIRNDLINHKVSTGMPSQTKRGSFRKAIVRDSVPSESRTCLSIRSPQSPVNEGTLELVKQHEGLWGL